MFFAEHLQVTASEFGTNGCWTEFCRNFCASRVKLYVSLARSFMSSLTFAQSLNFTTNPYSLFIKKLTKALVESKEKRKTVSKSYFC